MSKLNRQARTFSNVMGVLFLVIGVILLFAEAGISGSNVTIQEGSANSRAVQSGGILEWWAFIGLGFLCFALGLFIFNGRAKESLNE